MNLKCLGRSGLAALQDRTAGLNVVQCVLLPDHPCIFPLCNTNKCCLNHLSL